MRSTAVVCLMLLALSSSCFIKTLGIKGCGENDPKKGKDGEEDRPAYKISIDGELQRVWKGEIPKNINEIVVTMRKKPEGYLRAVGKAAGKFLNNLRKKKDKKKDKNDVINFLFSVVTKENLVETKIKDILGALMKKEKTTKKGEDSSLAGIIKTSVPGAQVEAFTFTEQMVNGVKQYEFTAAEKAYQEQKYSILNGCLAASASLKKAEDGVMVAFKAFKTEQGSTKTEVQKAEAENGETENTGAEK